MKIVKRTAALAFLLLASGFLSPAAAQDVRYFIYAPTESDKFPGSTQDSNFKAKKAEEVLSFSFRVENDVSIESVSSGGGSGKARFNGLELQFVGDLGIMPSLIQKAVTGDHYNDLVIEGALSSQQGASGSGANSDFFKLEMKLCLVEAIELVGTQGDQAIYSVIIQFGAMRMTTKRLKADGTFEAEKVVEWSVVKNFAVFEV